MSLSSTESLMHPGKNRARFYALGEKIFQVSWCLGWSVAEEVRLQGGGQLIPRTAAVTKISVSFLTISCTVP